MNLNLIYVRFLPATLAVLFGLLSERTFAAGTTFKLEGQSRGSTKWISGNLQNWRELDDIPCRVSINGGPISHQSITIDFPHLDKGIPGFEDLFDFEPSSNAVITSGPTLAMSGSGMRSYTFKVTVNNNQPAYVRFLARLAAGAHMNTGSSLMLGGSPSSMGKLQIHKPSPRSGSPDLAIVKSGPATAAPNEVITYTLSYTNKSRKTALGVQISDILPAGVSVSTNNLDGGRLVGNTIFWNLGTVGANKGGQISFPARVSPNAVNGQVLTNVALIKGCQKDANSSDNISKLLTTVVVTTCEPPVATPLTDLVRAIGANAFFSTSVSGTGPFAYQWLKDGIVINGQSGNTLTLVNLTLDDTGTYSVIVTGACGSVTNSATLTVDECFPAVDVMLVIDRSGSMKGKPYNDAKQACSNFVHNLNFSVDLAGLASYNSAATLDQTLTNNVVELEQAIASIPSADGYTSISRGIQTGQAELLSNRHNPDALPVLVLLSDGLPTGSDSPSNALYQATLAKNAGTRIFTVGLGAVDHALMAAIASSPGDYFYTTNSEQLTVLFDAISTIICRPPTNILLSGLSNQTVCVGETATFNVTASGCGPFTYQWKKDGQILAGETNNSLVVLNVSAANEGIYSVDVTGDCDTVTKQASLTVNSPLSIVTPPASQTNCVGGAVTFEIVATGSSLTYQWLKEGQLLAGQTFSSLLLSNVATIDQGLYSVIVSGPCGIATNNASLTVNSLVSATPLVSQTVCSGATVVFSTTASGTGPFSYVWLKDNAVLAGEITSSLTLTNVSAGNSGVYSVVVSGACGGITNSATLTVNTTVSATPLGSQTNCPGTTVVFSTTASGTGPFSYVWFKNGVLLGAESENSLVLNNITSDDAGIYSVIVSGTCGSVTNSAVLGVNTLVSATPLMSQTNCPGTTVMFSTVASGAGPFSYVWLKNGLLLSGQTAGNLTLSSITTDDAGIYSVIVSSACGSVTNSAVLEVYENTTATPLGNLIRNPGETVTFTTTASGSGPFTYVWKKNGIVIFGETGSSLVLSNVSVNDEATYTVEVTGQCNTVVQTGSLKINLPPTVSIITPTNGTVLIAPASFVIAADAQDPDGSVTNVEFFEGSTRFNETAVGNPYVISVTNLLEGLYVFTAKATDNGGLSATSAPVLVHILDQLPLVELRSGVEFNPQTGLYEQRIRVSNPTPVTLPAIRIYVLGLLPSVHVYNPSGTTNGIPFVQFNSPLPSGGSVDLVIEYYITSSAVPTPSLVALPVPANDGGGTVVDGTEVPINRVILRTDGSVLVEFATELNRIYYLQYNDGSVWKTAMPAVAGNGTWIQWIDAGPPKTDSAPSATRAYRVIVVSP